MAVVVFVLFVVVLALVIHSAIEERRVDDLAKKVERLEQRSTGFWPASYAYLNDLGEWATKKER